ncbi:MAG: guanylate kinase [Lentisphaeria bacterium]|nr:guanylate kinase [Lentisphaeria bacterium]
MEKIDFSAKGLGSIIVLSGPSGVGKSTIIKKVREKMPELRFSVSCTTRPMRQGEVADVDYHFLSKDEFLRRREAGDFIESADVFANCYGTLKSEVMSIAENGENVVLDIDVQGALQIMDKAAKDPLLAKEVEFIFIVPPSMEELERRLRSRATDSEEQITLRLSKAVHELSFWQKYEWLIVNDDADTAAEKLYWLIRNFSLGVRKH